MYHWTPCFLQMYAASDFRIAEVKLLSVISCEKLPDEVLRI